jgi:actin-related protein 8
MVSTYLKSDTQSLWARNSSRKNKMLPAEEASTIGPEQRRGSQVIVIHPGSRWLRIGKASDVNPASIPNVVARKTTVPIPEPIFVEGISRPRKGRLTPQPSQVQVADEYAVSVASDDPFDAKVAAITVSLRDRMRFYKLRVTQNAANIASTFNEPFKPEIIPEINDPFRIDWLQDPDEKVLVGEKALRLADPRKSGYSVRWPIHGTKFNTREYPSPQSILSDIETIIQTTLKEKFDVDCSEYKAKKFQCYNSN